MSTLASVSLLPPEDLGSLCRHLHFGWASGLPERPERRSPPSSGAAPVACPGSSASHSVDLNPSGVRCDNRGVSEVLYHFSEDPGIRRFDPHVPDTNPGHPPAVWAIDEPHAPLYWFPRDCPRVTAWPRNPAEGAAFRDAFQTVARRVHAIELGWLERMRATKLYRYTFDARHFVPWHGASGQWISEHAIEPLDVTPLGDLLQMHADAGIELRLVPSLWPLHDLAVSDRWDFSIVRMGNARPLT